MNKIVEKVEELRKMGEVRVNGITGENVDPFKLIRDCALDAAGGEHFVKVFLENMNDEEFLTALSVFHKIDMLAQVVLGDGYSEDICGRESTVEMLRNHKERAYGEAG